MDHVIRPVQADDWPKVKEIRLAMLRDPAAPVAFLETYEQGLRHPDSFWRLMAAGTLRPGTRTRQFVAEARESTWAGTVTMLVEEAGRADYFGGTVEQSQGHLVGVYVSPEHRGTGLIKELVAGALEWAWSMEDPWLSRVRLYVHEGNPRARAAYRKLGFVPTGEAATLGDDPSAKDLEMQIPRP
jgi:RimJ/RimL family protein N-acetyltransferase